MNRKQLNRLKQQIREQKEQAGDLQIFLNQILQLPYGQLKKVLTEEAIRILEKYGYSEGA